MTWLEKLVLSRSELESPLSFWKWAGLCSISAVVKDNVWMNRADIFNLYPNIYVMLHAASGLKKGPPIALARKLVGAVGNTRIISGRSSIQGILKEMGTSQTKPGGKVTDNSKIFICSSELSSSIVEDKVATTILTDLYDRQYNVGEWQSLLKIESFKLKDPTIIMFTATNEAHSDDFFAKKDIQGGYFARTFIIYETEPNRINSLSVPLKNPPNDTAAVDYLVELSKLHGPFQNIGSRIQDEIYTEMRIAEVLNKETGEIEKEYHYFTKAGAIYEDWYTSFREQIKEAEVKDETGTLNRFGDSVLKVAMLLALSEKPELVISERAMTEAIGICEKLIGAVRRTTLGAKGLSSSAMLKARIINELLNRDNHQVSRDMLMKKMWMHYGDSGEFDDLMLSFDSAGLIKTSAMGNKIIYAMPPDQVEEMKKFLSGKMQNRKVH